MLKISTRLTLWYTVSTSAIIIVIAFMTYSLYEQERRRSIDEDLQDYANFLLSEVSANTTTLSEVFNQLVVAKRKTVTQPITINNRFFISSNDSVIYEGTGRFNIDSVLDKMDVNKKFSFRDIYSTLYYQGSEFRTFSKPVDTKTFSKKFKKAGFNNLTLTVISPMSNFYKSLNELYWVFIVIVPFSILLSAFIGLIIARRAFRPIRDVTETAAEISSRNLGKRVPRPRSNDELSKLVDTFNQMIDRLDATFKSQQRFIADASHDIRTPLTVIQTDMELLLKRNQLNDETIDTVNRCLRETYSMSRLAENMMLLARSDVKGLSPEWAGLRLDEFLVDCISSLNSRAKSHGITFSVAINEAITIIADYNLLKRAIFNILDNAIKFSPDGDVVSLSLDIESEKAIIRINNKGDIIPQEMMAKIFERFSRGDKSRTTKGFGLGLAIAKTIIDLHNGTITVTSNEEEGTTFVMQLPIYE